MAKPNIKVNLHSAPTEVAPPTGGPAPSMSDAPPVPKEEHMDRNLRMPETADVPRREEREMGESYDRIEETKLEKETPTKPMETETPQTPAAEKPETQSKELQSAIAQKEHFRTKYEEAKKASPNIPGGSNPMEVVKLAKALEGYSEDEVSFITKNASDASIDSVIDATKDEWVQSAIHARREKVAKEKAIPSPSSVASNSPEESIPSHYYKHSAHKESEEQVRNVLLKRLHRQDRQERGGI